MIVATNIKVPSDVAAKALEVAEAMVKNSTYGHVEADERSRIDAVGFEDCIVIAVCGIAYPHVDSYAMKHSPEGWKGMRWVTISMVDGWMFGTARKVRGVWPDEMSVDIRRGDVVIVEAHRPHWLLPTPKTAREIGQLQHQMQWPMWHGLQWSCTSHKGAMSIVADIKKKWGDRT